MASPIDMLTSNVQSSQVTKSGSLQSGIAAQQVQAKPDIDTSPEPKVKASAKSSETLNSFRSSIGVDPVAIQAEQKVMDSKKAAANLQAVKAFAATGSLASAGDSTLGGVSV